MMAAGTEAGWEAAGAGVMGVAGTAAGATGRAGTTGAADAVGVAGVTGVTGATGGAGVPLAGGVDAAELGDEAPDGVEVESPQPQRETVARLATIVSCRIGFNIGRPY